MRYIRVGDRGVVDSLRVECDGILILVDIFGALPCNVAAMTMAKYPDVDVVTGLNLPMLLEVLLQRNTHSLLELTKVAKRYGVEGIKTISDLIS